MSTANLSDRAQRVLDTHRQGFTAHFPSLKSTALIYGAASAIGCLGSYLASATKGAVPPYVFALTAVLGGTSIVLWKTIDNAMKFRFEVMDLQLKGLERRIHQNW